MKAIAASLVFASLAFSGFAQDPVNVSVAANGDDVRQVIHSLFDQAKKSYVLEPNVRFVLFLSLRDFEFEEALQLVCKNSGLTYEVQNGVYFVNKIKAPVLKPQPEPKAPTSTSNPSGTEVKTPKPQTETKTGSAAKIPVVKSDPKSSVAKKSDPLKRSISTKLSKVDIRSLFAELGRQAGVKISVNTNVPAYRLDAFLKATSLKFALDSICGAASLNYTLTGETVTISAKSRR